MITFLNDELTLCLKENKISGKDVPDNVINKFLKK